MESLAANSTSACLRSITGQLSWEADVGSAQISITQKRQSDSK
jgi:hypothetical protein